VTDALEVAGSTVRLVPRGLRVASVLAYLSAAVTAFNGVRGIVVTDDSWALKAFLAAFSLATIAALVHVGNGLRALRRSAAWISIGVFGFLALPALFIPSHPVVLVIAATNVAVITLSIFYLHELE